MNDDGRILVLGAIALVSALALAPSGARAVRLADPRLSTAPKVDTKFEDLPYTRIVMTFTFSPDRDQEKVAELLRAWFKQFEQRDNPNPYRETWFEQIERGDTPSENYLAQTSIRRGEVALAFDTKVQAQMIWIDRFGLWRRDDPKRRYIKLSQIVGGA